VNEVWFSKVVKKLPCYIKYVSLFPLRNKNKKQKTKKQGSYFNFIRISNRQVLS